VEQRLGKDSNIGYFGRFGLGDEDLARINGAAAQVATGIAILAPNVTGKEKDASDYFAAGFVWTQAPDRAAVHQNEFGVEITYACPITPTLTLQPDLQILWDPVYGNSSTNVVFQLQLVMTW
jgi:porin